LFISNQAIGLVVGPYPPFGLITSVYIGLSSYVVLIGIYSSVLALSQDTKLRQTIKKLAWNELNLLDSISAAQIEREIISKVVKIIRDNQDLILKETGIQSSITDEDAKVYLHEVLAEKSKIETNLEKE
jgi:hypothetical protein